ncbi:TPA: LTA synthase family protein [Streptococcus suis]
MLQLDMKDFWGEKNFMLNRNGENSFKKILISFFLLLIGFVFSYLLIVSKFDIERNSFWVNGLDNGFSFLFSTVLVFYYSHFLTKSNLFKFLIGGLILLGILYYVLATRSLNNPVYNFYDFFTNGLIPVDYLLKLNVGLIFTLFILKYNKFKIETNSVDPNLLIGILLTPIVLTHSEFLAYINETKKYDVYSLFSIYLFILIILVICLKGLDKIVENKPSIYNVVFLSLLMSFFFNGTIQYGIKLEEMVLKRYIFPGATLYQIIILFFLFLTVYLIGNRVILPTLINLLIGGSISIVNYLKFEMRNEPFLISDFIWIKEIKFLSSFINRKILISIFLVLLLIVPIYLFLNKKLFPGKVIHNLKTRLICLLVPLLFFSGIFTVFKNKTESKIIEGIPVVSVLNNWQNISWFGFSTDARYKSLMYVWTKQLTDVIMEKPKNYSKSSISDLVEKYTERANEINKTRSENISDQTVIYILSESLSNPNRVEGVTVSENILANIDSIKSQTMSGLMKSDGFGGGTANMEFQSLTGLPLYNFSSSVSVLMTEILPKLKVIPSISDQFKNGERLVIHGLNASYYNRQTFYKNLNFERKIFLTESDETLQNVEYFGANVSDETTYKNILSRIDISENQFFSVITIQNHSPWIVEDPNSVIASSEKLDKFQQNSLSSYVNMLKITDEETASFLHELQNIDKKITVVFYGDHLPGLYSSELFMENPESQYQTDYFIWSNYETHKEDYPLVNSSDFTAALLKHTNAKVTPYQALLTDILDNAGVDKIELNNDEQQIANDLKLLQYDLTIGKGFLKQYPEFFEGE